MKHTCDCPRCMVLLWLGWVCCTEVCGLPWCCLRFWFALSLGAVLCRASPSPPSHIPNALLNTTETWPTVGPSRSLSMPTMPSPTVYSRGPGTLQSHGAVQAHSSLAQGPRTFVPLHGGTLVGGVSLGAKAYSTVSPRPGMSHHVSRSAERGPARTRIRTSSQPVRLSRGLALEDSQVLFWGWWMRGRLPGRVGLLHANVAVACIIEPKFNPLNCCLATQHPL